MKIYFDGQFVEEDHAICVYRSRLSLWRWSIYHDKGRRRQSPFFKRPSRRIQNHCQTLGIKPPTIKIDSIKELIVKNHAENGSWRLKIIITGGSSSNHSLNQRDHGHLVMILKPYSVIERTISMTVYPYPIHRPSASIKKLSLSRPFMGQRLCDEEGARRCPHYYGEGIVLESSFSNIFGG